VHTKVAAHRVVQGFERILEALAEELIESTDDELLEAAKDLGMDPTMRGSAALLGLTSPATHRPSDFFEVTVFHQQQIESERGANARPLSRKRQPGRTKRPKPSHSGPKSGR
jgi:hypothetical protein